VSEAEPAPVTSASDSKSNPFGAARPIDTAAREKEIEEKRQLALRQKKDADDKAREERKAKEVSEKAVAKEKTAGAPPTPTTEKPNPDGSEEKPASRNYEILRRVGEEEDAEGDEEAPVDAPANGNAVQDKAVKSKEAVRDSPKSEGTWRRKSSTPGAPAGSTAEKVEDDGWSTVPAKPNKKQGRGGAARAIAS
jgi:translation initiation factor 4B